MTTKKRELTPYTTAITSDRVKDQSVDSLVINKDVATINTAPKEYDSAVTDMFAGYFFKTGAWKFWGVVRNLNT